MGLAGEASGSFRDATKLSPIAPIVPLGYRTDTLKAATLPGKVIARLAPPSTYHTFISGCDQRISQRSVSLPDLNLLSVGNGDYVRLCLTDLELWVQSSLDDWLRANMERQAAVTALAALIDTYTTVASLAYKDMPEDISVMLLTSMDLWVALDKCTLHHCTLLHDYTPGFPPSLFEPLMLPKKHQMERLLYIEQYLAGRRAAAVPDSRPSFDLSTRRTPLLCGTFSSPHITRNYSKGLKQRRRTTGLENHPNSQRNANNIVS